MTSTSFNIGIGNLDRATSKVLKPPGGGSSDIFGKAENGEQQTNGHNGKQNGANGGEPVVRQTSCNDRLFGAAAQQAEKALANGNSDSGSEANGISETDGGKTNGHATTNGHAATNGKPAKENGIAMSASQPAAATKKRIPPGGYSSGLW